MARAQVYAQAVQVPVRILVKALVAVAAQANVVNRVRQAQQL